MDVPLQYIRALPPSLKATFVNICSEGFWSRCTLLKPVRREFKYRLCNQTRRCQGPWLIIFESDPPELDWLPMPQAWVKDGKMHVRVQSGTLVPSTKLDESPRQKRAFASPELTPPPTESTQTTPARVRLEEPPSAQTGCVVAEAWRFQKRQVTGDTEAESVVDLKGFSGTRFRQATLEPLAAGQPLVELKTENVCAAAPQWTAQYLAYPNVYQHQLPVEAFAMVPDSSLLGPVIAETLVPVAPSGLPTHSTTALSSTDTAGVRMHVYTAGMPASLCIALPAREGGMSGALELEVAPSQGIVLRDMPFPQGRKEGTARVQCCSIEIGSEPNPLCTGVVLKSTQRFGDKFCVQCSTAGLHLPVTRVRALTPALQAKYHNQPVTGVWSMIRDHHPGLYWFRVVNQSKGSTGPRLVIFKDGSCPPEEWGVLPAEWVDADGMIEFKLAYGTLSIRHPKEPAMRLQVC